MRAFGLLVSALSFTISVLAASEGGFKYKRLDKNDTVLLIVDQQTGLMPIVHDWAPDEFRSAVMAHAELAKVFNLPVVMTTSGQSGPNGPLPKEILDMHKDMPLIKRQGELNAWDNEEFRKAVKATGKKQVILAAITTDVCAAFLALSLIEEGYEVYHNSDASGAASVRTAKDANDRMRAAGVQVMGQYALACELMRDWRAKPGALEMFPYFDKYWTSYAWIARSHAAALTQNGTVFPGETV